MDLQAGLCEAGYLVIPKEEVLIDSEITYNREDVGEFIMSKEERCTHSLPLDIADVDQLNTNIMSPIRTETVLSKDIIDLQKMLKCSKDEAVSRREADAEITDKGQTSRSPKASRKSDVLQKVPPAAESMMLTSKANFSTPENRTNLVAGMSTFLPVDSDNTSAVDFGKRALRPANGGIYYTLRPMQEERPSLTQKIDNIVTQMPLVLENQKRIINNQKLLGKNQQIMLMKICEMSTKFEEFVKQCNSSTITKESEQIQFNIINSPEEADLLESNLKDEVYKTKLKNNFSVVCGKGKGFNNAYVLIDLIFTREFLSQCSWAGGSRKVEAKTCFRAYTRIFDFFFDLIKMTDDNFTKEDCKTFFKNILRNSTSRIKAKQMRASVSRKRPKLINLKKLETKVKRDEAPIASKPSLSEDAQKSNSSNEESLC